MPLVAIHSWGPFHCMHEKGNAACGNIFCKNGFMDCKWSNLNVPESYITLCHSGFVPDAAAAAAANEIPDFMSFAMNSEMHRGSFY